MDKTEKLLKQHPVLSIVLLILIIIEILKLFVLMWILVHLLWPSHVKRLQH